MSYLKRLQRFLASVIVVTFFVTNTLTPAPIAHASTEVFGPGSQISNFTIPAEFGKVTDLIPASPSNDLRPATSGAPVLIHIQEAHANYDAQTNIKKILEHLSQNYSVNLILLEGAGNKLQPGLFNFFPQDKALNQAITDRLMKAGQLSGAEVFLIDQRPETIDHRQKKDFSLRSLVSSLQSGGEAAEAYGVENAEAYAQDREAYKSVYENRKTLDDFLADFYLQWQKQAGLRMNKELREFLSCQAAYDEEKLPLQDWMEFLRKEASRALSLDLGDVRAQLDWPLLVRYFRLREISGKIDEAKASKEQDAFLADLRERKIPAPLFQEITKLLEHKSTGDLPLYKTRFTFERLMDLLPKDYSFESYPVFRLYLQQMILMSELQGEMLQQEIQELTKRVVEKLAVKAEEKKLTGVLREYQLLRKLFHLELSREEYQQIKSRGISPEKLFKDGGWRMADGVKRQTQNALRLPPSALRSVTTLYSKAVGFYEIAVTREDAMMQNAMKILSSRKDKKAVLITGGFHAEGFKEKITSSGSSYIGITPVIGEIRPEDEKNYLRALLGSYGVRSTEYGEKKEADAVRRTPSALPASNIGATGTDIPFMSALGPGYVASRRSEMREIGRQVIAAERPGQKAELWPGYEAQLAKVFGPADAANKAVLKTLAGDHKKRSEARVAEKSGAEESGRLTIETRVRQDVGDLLSASRQSRILEMLEDFKGRAGVKEIRTAEDAGKVLQGLDGLIQDYSRKLRVWQKFMTPLIVSAVLIALGIKGLSFSPAAWWKTLLKWGAAAVWLRWAVPALIEVALLPPDIRDLSHLAKTIRENTPSGHSEVQVAPAGEPVVQAEAGEKNVSTDQTGTLPESLLPDMNFAELKERLVRMAGRNLEVTAAVRAIAGLRGPGEVTLRQARDLATALAGAIRKDRAFSAILFRVIGSSMEAKSEGHMQQIFVRNMTAAAITSSGKLWMFNLADTLSGPSADGGREAKGPAAMQAEANDLLGEIARGGSFASDENFRQLLSVIAQRKGSQGADLRVGEMNALSPWIKQELKRLAGRVRKEREKPGRPREKEFLRQIEVFVAQCRAAGFDIARDFAGDKSVADAVVLISPTRSEVRGVGGLAVRADQREGAKAFLGGQARGQNVYWADIQERFPNVTFLDLEGFLRASGFRFHADHKGFFVARSETRTFLQAFITMFVAVNALGVLPFVISIMNGAEVRERAKVIRNSLFTAGFVAISFLLAGDALLKILGIDNATFRIAGGIVLFLISVKNILGEKDIRTEAAEEMASVPIGVPFIVGPAVITTILALKARYGAWTTGSVTILNILIAGIVFHFGASIERFLGKNGIRTLSKVASLLLASMGVGMVLKGLTEEFLPAGATYDRKPAETITIEEVVRETPVQVAEALAALSAGRSEMRDTVKPEENASGKATRGTDVSFPAEVLRREQIKDYALQLHQFGFTAREVDALYDLYQGGSAGADLTLSVKRLQGIMEQQIFPAHGMSNEKPKDKASTMMDFVQELNRLEAEEKARETGEALSAAGEASGKTETQPVVSSAFLELMGREKQSSHSFRRLALLVLAGSLLMHVSAFTVFDLWQTGGREIKKILRTASEEVMRAVDAAGDWIGSLNKSPSEAASQDSETEVDPDDAASPKGRSEAREATEEMTIDLTQYTFEEGSRMTLAEALERILLGEKKVAKEQLGEVGVVKIELSNSDKVPEEHRSLKYRFDVVPLDEVDIVLERMIGFNDGALFLRVAVVRDAALVPVSVPFFDDAPHSVASGQRIPHGEKRVLKIHKRTAPPKKIITGPALPSKPGAKSAPSKAWLWITLTVTGLVIGGIVLAVAKPWEKKKATSSFAPAGPVAAGVSARSEVRAGNEVVKLQLGSHRIEAATQAVLIEGLKAWQKLGLLLPEKTLQIDAIDAYPELKGEVEADQFLAVHHREGRDSEAEVLFWNDQEQLVGWLVRTIREKAALEKEGMAARPRSPDAPKSAKAVFESSIGDKMMMRIFSVEGREEEVRRSDDVFTLEVGSRTFFIRIYIGAGDIDRFTNPFGAGRSSGILTRTLAKNLVFTTALALAGKWQLEQASEGRSEVREEFAGKMQFTAEELAAGGESSVFNFLTAQGHSLETLKARTVRFVAREGNGMVYDLLTGPSPDLAIDGSLLDHWSIRKVSDLRSLQILPLESFGRSEARGRGLQAIEFRALAAGFLLVGAVVGPNLWRQHRRVESLRRENQALEAKRESLLREFFVAYVRENEATEIGVENYLKDHPEIRKSFEEFLGEITVEQMQEILRTLMTEESALPAPVPAETEAPDAKEKLKEKPEEDERKSPVRPSVDPMGGDMLETALASARSEVRGTRAVTVVPNPGKGNVAFHFRPGTADSNLPVVETVEAILKNQGHQSSDFAAVTVIADYKNGHYHPYVSFESFVGAHQNMTLGAIYNISFEGRLKTGRSEARAEDSVSWSFNSIMHIAWEMAPFKKAGGLADVIGELPLAMKRKYPGMEVSVTIPYHQDLDLQGLEPVPFSRFGYDSPDGYQNWESFKVEYRGMNIFLLQRLSMGAEKEAPLFVRGYKTDNFYEGANFSKAAVEFMAQSGMRPDIVHPHDQMASYVPDVIRDTRDKFFWESAVFYTAHHFAPGYQGREDLERGRRYLMGLGLSAGLFGIGGALNMGGQLNPLQGASRTADFISTVSGVFAWEAATSGLSEGLQGLLAHRFFNSQTFKGVTNAIDKQMWSPETGNGIRHPFTQATLVEGKQANKAYLQTQYGLKQDPKAPVLSFISRYDPYVKGFDIVPQVVGELMSYFRDLQVVFAGDGDEGVKTALRRLKEYYPDRVYVSPGFVNADTVRSILSATDFVGMPSRIEPAGLVQQQGHMLGAIPIVTRVGGLEETVHDPIFIQDTGAQTGFKSNLTDHLAITFAMSAVRALGVYYRDRDRGTQELQRIRLDGRDSVSSWDDRVDEYFALYQKALQNRKQFIANRSEVRDEAVAPDDLTKISPSPEARVFLRGWDLGDKQKALVQWLQAEPKILEGVRQSRGKVARISGHAGFYIRKGKERILRVNLPDSVVNFRYKNGAAQVDMYGILPDQTEAIRNDGLAKEAFSGLSLQPYSSEGKPTTLGDLLREHGIVDLLKGAFPVVLETRFYYDRDTDRIRSVTVAAGEGEVPFEVLYDAEGRWMSTKTVKIQTEEMRRFVPGGKLLFVVRDYEKETKGLSDTDAKLLATERVPLIVTAPSGNFKVWANQGQEVAAPSETAETVSEDPPQRKWWSFAGLVAAMTVVGGLVTSMQGGLWRGVSFGGLSGVAGQGVTPPSQTFTDAPDKDSNARSEARDLRKLFEKARELGFELRWQTGKYRSNLAGERLDNPSDENKKTERVFVQFYLVHPKRDITMEEGYAFQDTVEAREAGLHFVGGLVSRDDVARFEAAPYSPIFSPEWVELVKNDHASAKARHEDPEHEAVGSETMLPEEFPNLKSPARSPVKKLMLLMQSGLWRLSALWARPKTAPSDSASSSQSPATPSDTTGKARSEMRSWQEENVPELEDYTVISRQLEAGLSRDILDKLKAKFGEKSAGLVAATTVTGGLGALMHDLFPSWQKNFGAPEKKNIDAFAVNVIYDEIKGQAYAKDLPEEVTNGKKTLGDYLREVLTEDPELRLNVFLDAGDEFRTKADEWIGRTGDPLYKKRLQQARAAVDREIKVKVYPTETSVGGMPNFYVEAFYIADDGTKVQIFDEVYPDAPHGAPNLWRDLQMGVYRKITELLTLKLQEQGVVKKKILFVDNEVFVSLPTPLLPDALHHHMNHSVFAPTIYQPDEASLEVLGYSRALRPYIVRSGKISITDAAGMTFDLITGVALYEHTPAVTGGVMPGYADVVDSYNEDGLRSTNGVLLEQWQSPLLRGLIDTYKKKLGMDVTVDDRVFFSKLSDPASGFFLNEFKERTEVIKAFLTGRLMLWLKESQNRPAWFDQAMKAYKEEFGLTEIYGDRLLVELNTRIQKALKNENEWAALLADPKAQALKREFLKTPIVSNVRRQVSYKGPDKWIEVLRALKADPTRLEWYKKNAARAVIGGREFGKDAHDLFLEIQHLVRELGLEDKFATIENYNIEVAPIIFQGISGSVMLSYEILEASATSMMKGLPNGAILIGVWGGAEPELFTIMEPATGREVNIFKEHVTYEELVKKLHSGVWMITNGFLVEYSASGDGKFVLNTIVDGKIQTVNARPPSADSLANALVQLQDRYQVPSARRDLIWEAFRSSPVVDMEKSQARAHMKLWQRTIVRSGKEKALLEKPGLSPESALKLLSKRAGDDAGFVWRNESPNTLEISPPGPLAFIESARQIRTHAAEGYRSVAYHAGRGDIFAKIFHYLEAFKNEIPELYEEMTRLKTRADGASDLLEKVQINLAALRLFDRFVIALSENVLQGYIHSRSKEYETLLKNDLFRQNLYFYLETQGRRFSSLNKSLAGFAVREGEKKYIVALNLGEPKYPGVEGGESKAWGQFYGQKEFEWLTGQTDSGSLMTYQVVNAITGEVYGAGEDRRPYSFRMLAQGALPVGVPSPDIQILELRAAGEMKPEEEREQLASLILDDLRALVSGNPWEQLRQQKPRAYWLKKMLSYYQHSGSGELKMRLQAVSGIGRDKAIALFGAEGVRPVMAFVAAWVPELLEEMKDWDPEVYVALKGVMQDPEMKDLFQQGEVSFNDASRATAVVVSRTLVEVKDGLEQSRHVVIPIHFSKFPYNKEEGKVWFGIGSIAMLGLLPGMVYQTRDLILGQVYEKKHTLSSLLKEGWRTGIPVVKRKDPAGIQQPGWRFQVLQMVPVGVNRSELREMSTAEVAAVVAGVLKDKISELRRRDVSSKAAWEETVPFATVAFWEGHLPKEATATALALYGTAYNTSFKNGIDAASRAALPALDRMLAHLESVTQPSSRSGLGENKDRVLTGISSRSEARSSLANASIEDKESPASFVALKHRVQKALLVLRGGAINSAENNALIELAKKDPALSMFFIGELISLRARTDKQDVAQEALRISRELRTDRALETIAERDLKQEAGEREGGLVEASSTIEDMIPLNVEAGGGTEQGFFGVTEGLTDGIWSLYAHKMNALEAVASLLPASYSQKKSEQLQAERIAKALKMAGFTDLQDSDGVILDAQLALDEGGIAMMDKVFPGRPFAVLTRNEKDVQFLRDLSVRRQAAGLFSIESATSIDEAQDILYDILLSREHKKPTYKAMALATDIHAVALKKQFGDNAAVFELKRFKTFLGVAGVSQLVSAMQAEYLATARSA